MTKVIVRYWAAAKEAAGAEAEEYSGATLAEALAALRTRHGENSALVRVLERSSFLVDATPVGRRRHDAVPLSEGSTIEVLPPFAGG